MKQMMERLELKLDMTAYACNLGDLVKVREWTFCTEGRNIVCEG